MKTNQNPKQYTELYTQTIVITCIPFTKKHCNRCDEEHSQIFILCKHCNFVHVNINHYIVGHLYKNKEHTLCRCWTVYTLITMRQN